MDSAPQDIRLLGQAKHGVYDEVDTIDPVLLHRYYGAGAWLDDEESDLTSNEHVHEHQSQRDIAEVIATAQSRNNVRHEAAAVAKNSSPFEDEHDTRAFALALDAVLALDTYPAGFDLDREYESFESYKTGRSTKLLVIPLPYDVWFPRIVVWSKALNLLKIFPLCKATLSS